MQYDKNTLKQKRALEAIRKTISLDEVIAEEKFEESQRKKMIGMAEQGEKQRAEHHRLLNERREQEKINTGLEKKLSEFLYCFGNEWQQILFQTLCYCPDRIGAIELRNKVREAIGPDNYCPDTFRNYLLKFCDSGFATKGHTNGKESYFPTEMGARYALPGIMRMLSWEIENKTSSNVFVGFLKSSNGNFMESRRIKMLELLAKNPDKKLSISKMVRKVGTDRRNVRRHIALLEEGGFVSYRSPRQGEKYGMKIWIGKRNDVKRAKKDPRLKIYPKRIKPKIIDALSRSNEGMSYRDVAQAINYKKDPSPISSLLADLCKYGYACPTFGGEGSRSEISISDKGGECLDYVQMLAEIKNGPLNLDAFALKESYREFRKKAEKAAGLYFPYSRSYKMYQKKLPKIISYLRENGETNAEEIYKNAPVKDPLLLNLAVKDGILKKREINRRGWFTEVKYSLA